MSKPQNNKCAKKCDKFCPDLNELDIQSIDNDKCIKVDVVKANKAKFNKLKAHKIRANDICTDDLNINNTLNAVGKLNIGGLGSTINFIDGNTYLLASEDKATVMPGFTDVNGINRVLQSIQMYNFILSFTATAPILANIPTPFATLIGGDIPLATTYGVAILNNATQGWFMADSTTGMITINMPTPIVVGDMIRMNHVYLTA